MTIAATARRAQGEATLTRQVLDRFRGTPDARLRKIMGALVTHLHEFARDIRLTEAEWDATIRFLTEVGHITDDRRQEFILLSDVLGLSMLTIGINHPIELGATESTVFGPFFVDDAPLIELGGDIAGSASGEPSWVEGTVRGLNGAPIRGARIEAWEADDDVQYDNGRTAGPRPIPARSRGQLARRLRRVPRHPFRPRDRGRVRGAGRGAAHHGRSRPNRRHVRRSAPTRTVAVADAARASAAEVGADALISIGGGSTTGTAKIVALTSGLPIIAVPTTYAGSEMTPVWGLTTDARKETGTDLRVLPAAFVYDSALLAALPRQLGVASGFNALAHCVEAFWGPGANPVTSLHAAAGIRALTIGLRGRRFRTASQDLPYPGRHVRSAARADACRRASARARVQRARQW